MATVDERAEVRSNTNTTETEYDNDTLDELIDAGSVECASATIWKWELAKVGKNSSLKASSTGVESHTFNSIKEKMDYYKGMYEFWKGECQESQGYNTSAIVKATPQSVGGVLTEDQINGDLDI